MAIDPSQVLQDYYAILGLEDTATRVEIKKKYRELAKQHHPDKKNVQQKTFGEIQSDLDGRRVSEAADFRLIQAAWETLSDPESRKEYDKELSVYRQERAKIERRQERERAKQKKKEDAEEKLRLKKAKKEAERAAQEAALQMAAERKADEEFLEELYNDFGEDDSHIAFELRNLARRSQDKFSQDPELETRITDPELEDISNQQTPSRHSASKGRRHAECWGDPELETRQYHSPGTAKLAEEMSRAMNMRLSDPKMSCGSFTACADPDLLQVPVSHGVSIDDVE